MTLFKNLDLYYDKVVIDNNIIPKPSYVSTTQWNEFWKAAIDVNESNSNLESLIERRAEEIADLTEKNIDNEVEKAQDTLIKDFSRNIMQASKKIEIQFSLAGMPEDSELLGLVLDIVGEAEYVD